MGSVPKIARQLSQHARVVVFSGGARTRIENRSKNLRIYFFKEWLIPDPVNNGFIPLIITKLNSVIEKEKPDVVLNVKHMFQSSLLVLPLKHKGYRVISATDTFPGFNWFTASTIGNIVLWIYARTLPILVLRKSDKVVLYHEGLVPVARKLKLDYVVIPNGVEFEIIDAAKPKKLPGEINIIYVGRLESVKGYETICNSMQELTQKNKNVHFTHIGDDRGKEDFVAKYRSPQMHFLGRKNISDTYSHMKGADIILLASKSEGLPNTIMEGMACGCVPISTPVGAVPRLLEGGKLGRLFAYEDEKGLLKAAEWLIEHPKERARMAVAGKAKIRKEYNWKTLTKHYMEILFP